MEVIWSPAPEVLEQANVVRLMRKLGYSDYRQLQQFSQDEPERFWPAAIEDLGLEFSKPWKPLKLRSFACGRPWPSSSRSRSRSLSLSKPKISPIASLKP